MRKIAATYVFPGNCRPPVKNGILVCDDEGAVVDLIDKGADFREEAGMEFYSGVLVPGFINAHCHLELSHLFGKVNEKTGIGDFIRQINGLRNTPEKEMLQSMQIADRKMQDSGIVAVGDISNTSLSIKNKCRSKIFYHTFVEVFGFHPSRATRAFEQAVRVKKEFEANHLPVSVVPHAPYSVSASLFEKLKAEAGQGNGPFSIHNQESRGESQFYADGTGPMAEHLQQNIGIDISYWQPTGKSSLQSILKYMPQKNKLLLVHNTYTTSEDLDELCQQRPRETTFIVLCPNANLYIENALPPVLLLKKYGVNICLGTDSLASNHQLSVLDEMRTLQRNFIELSMAELVDWACINGAKALGIEDKLGSFDPGKKPGVNLLTGFDLKNRKITTQTKLKRLL